MYKTIQIICLCLQILSLLGISTEVLCLFMLRWPAPIKLFSKLKVACEETESTWTLKAPSLSPSCKNREVFWSHCCSQFWGSLLHCSFEAASPRSGSAVASTAARDKTGPCLASSVGSGKALASISFPWWCSAWLLDFLPLHVINSLQMSPYSVVIYIHSTSVQYWEISFSTLKPLWDYHHRLLDCDGVSPGAVFAKELLLRKFPTPQTSSRTLLISTCLLQNCHVGTFHGSIQQTEAVSRFKHFNTSLHGWIWVTISSTSHYNTFL